MKQTYVWGGEVEISVFALLFRIGVVVHYDGHPYFKYDLHNGNNIATIHLNWTGNHYTFINNIVH